MLNLDVSVVYQLIGFFVLFIILSRFLFNPVRRIFEERHSKTEGLLEESREIEAGLEEKLQEYEKKLQSARAEAHAVRSGLRQEGKGIAGTIIESAAAKSSKKLLRVRNELAEEKKKTLVSLSDTTESLSGIIVSRLLDRKTIHFVAFFILVPFATLAFGAEEGAHGGGSEGGLFWLAVNFVIFVIGFYIVWIKYLKGNLARRGDAIRKAIDDAKKARAEADRKVAEFKRKVDSIEEHMEEIRRELIAEGEAERERIIDDARREAEKIMEEAKATISHEMNKANDYVRQEIALLAVEMARESVKKEFTETDQNRLLEYSIEKIKLN